MDQKSGFKKGILGLIALATILLVSASSAQAVVIPSKSVVNPVTQTLYVPDNGTGPASIHVYQRDENATFGWSEITTLPKTSATAKVFGTAVSEDGSKLYVSIADAYQSKLRIYNLNLDGTPNGTSTTANWTAQSYDSPAGVAVAEGVVYMANMGVGEVRYFDATTGAPLGIITEGLAGKTNIYDVAIGPVQRTADSISYPIFVTRKAKSSTTQEIFMYKYSKATAGGASITLVNSYDAEFPTYMKVAGDTLYVAVNGTDGNDILVYTIGDSSLTLAGSISSGITGAYGWTGFDISPDGSYLYFTQAKDSTETKTDVYLVKLPGTTATFFTTTTPKADGLVFSPDRRRIVKTYSGDGSIQGFIATDENGTPLTLLAPVFTSIVPDSTTYGVAVNVVITGDNFINSNVAKTVPSLYYTNLTPLDNVVVESRTRITASVSGVTPDKVRIYDLHLTNKDLDGVTPDQSVNTTAADVFTINFTVPQNLLGHADDASGNPLIGGGIRWTWDLNNQGETNYDLLDENGNVLKTVNEVAPNFITTVTENGLSANVLHSRRIRVRFNNELSHDGDLVSVYSSAAAPVISSITAEAAPSVTLTLDANGNPAGTRFEIWRSEANGPFSLIATTTDTTYTDTSVTHATSYTYKARALNGNDQPSAFSPEVSITTPYGITITKPVPGQTWFAEHTFNITWTTVGVVQNVKIEFSKNNGGTWSVLEASIPNAGTYAWTIAADAVSPNCFIRISDASDGVPFGVSGRFLIERDNAAPRLVSHIPASDEVGVASNVTLQAVFEDDHGIDWSSLTPSNIVIDGYQTVNINQQNTGTWGVKVTTTVSFQPDVPLAANSTVTVHLIGGANGIRDLAGNPFTATEYSWSFRVAGPPTVTNVYPRRAPNTADTNIMITGTNFSAGNSVDIQTNPATTLNSSVISSTEISATVPAGIIPGTYHITVTNANGPSAQTAADTFEVMSGPEVPPTPSQIKDFNATDGENGQSTLTWTNPSDDDMALIEVRRYDSGFPAAYDPSGTLVYTAIPTPGAAVSTVEAGLSNGSTYYYVAFIRDTSGNWSAVDSVTPEVNADKATVGVVSKSITVRTPNGGETWNVASQQNITWESTGSIANVSIEVSVNAGNTWSPVVTVANSGSYSWTVPNTPTTEARIKISDASDPAVSDTSDANFTIQTGVTTGEKTFNIVYISETQAENWISIPFNSPKVNGVAINTIGDLMTSLVVFPPANGDIMTLMWNDNATQTVKSAMRDYSGTGWNSWDPQMETQPITIGGMYIVSISNSNGRQQFNTPWTVSGIVPAPGEVKFSLSYLSETQAENWISVPNETGLITKGALLDSLARAFTAQNGDIVTLREYNNTTQTTASAMRDFNGTSWNSWDPAKEAEAITLGDTFIFSISNSSGRTTFTVIWP
jgi:hypothetical protein